MSRTGHEEDQPIDLDLPLRELRRGYHDRIAGLRDQSLTVLGSAVTGTLWVTEALVEGEGPTPDPRSAPEAMQALAAAVDAEVVGLLALESPVARDLRVILASRDVTQLSLLCVGLCVNLGGRVTRASAALSSEQRILVASMGSGTGRLLRDAEAAWVALDAERARSVAGAAVDVRAAQTEFLTALIAMDGVPMDAALDLSMVARVYERLGDHAVEIAERVLFAVLGTPAPLLGP